MRSFAAVEDDAGRALLARVRLLVSGGLQYGDGDAALPCDPRSPPTRCVFQCTGRDGTSECFPVEYILRLMANWAQVPCDPYLRIQNTGVSVLLQAYFYPPANAPLAGVTAEQNNVTLRSTQHTGISLSFLDTVKTDGGLDQRPFYAMMVVYCFVRMPNAQLAFRFMGPESAHRAEQLADRAIHQCMSDREARNARRRSATPERRHAPSPPPPTRAPSVWLAGHRHGTWACVALATLAVLGLGRALGWL